MKRVPARLEDGRIVDSAPIHFWDWEEFKNGLWVKPSAPVTFDDAWNCSLISEDEFRKLTKGGSFK